jgi:hypothetical protein
MLKSFFSLFKLFSLGVEMNRMKDSKFLKKLWVITFRPKGLVVIDCVDVTDEYVNVSENERIFRVEYYKDGEWYIERIRFTGEYSNNQTIRKLQEYCVERVKHVRENTS